MKKLVIAIFSVLMSVLSSASYAQEDRPYIRQMIGEYGECQNVAITETQGNVMLSGRNGWAASGCPQQLVTVLQKLHDGNRNIKDVQLAENGQWLVLYDNNGMEWSSIPQSLEHKVREFNANREVITSVTFNAGGDWIVVTTDHYSASEQWILEWLQEGNRKYGKLWTACVTHKAIAAVYEEGFRYYGEVPASLKDALATTHLDVYRLKIAGNSWFFADEMGRYQYLFGNSVGTNVSSEYSWNWSDFQDGNYNEYGDYDEGYGYGYGDDFEMSGSGTCFALSSDGYLATCNHVVDGARRIQIRGVNGDFNTAYKAKVVAYDAKNDVAIVKIDDARFKSLGEIPYSVNLNAAEIGESVFVLGYPLRAVMGDEIKLTNGVVSATTGFQGDPTTYQISATVQAGNSGGPLFDEDGNIIGIVSSRLTSYESASYAVKTKYLSQLMKNRNLVENLPSDNLIKGKKLNEQVRAVKKFVYIIETEN